MKLGKTREDEKVDYDYKSIDKGHHKVHYRGILAQRSPFDYVTYQMILHEVAPDLVIEIGTNFGGGALYLADLMETFGKGIVHTVDITDNCTDIVKSHPRIETFHKGFVDYDLSMASSYENILVIEDASHMYEDSIAIMEKFAPLVSVGSYLIVEDGVVDKLGVSKAFHGGPCKAIREFMPIHPEFIVDRKWCDFFGKNSTNNVNGFLKKIK